MRTLNLGIVAHVDAGKTSLTERLLHRAGVIDRVGSVDAGSTTTDSLALERQRGITIRAAVVSFELDDVIVNLIDTPGHPDFIAEVERVLHLLDGVVLVVSAVEGVQAQTRVLFRALQRLRIATVLFVNKIDRRGADVAAVLGGIADKLTPHIVALHTAEHVGTSRARVIERHGRDPAFVDELVELLADHDDDVLADYLDAPARLTPSRLLGDLARSSRRVAVHPVLLGSAMTGAGVDALTGWLPRLLLPSCTPDEDGPVSGTVFKIERGADGAQRVYVRLFTGTLRTRDRIELRGELRRITGIEVFEAGTTRRHPRLRAGRIGLVTGLGDVRIGDIIGRPTAGDPRDRWVAPPSLESIVEPCRAEERGALYAALTQLVEQDPLIGLRQDDVRQELSVTLFGEVQKEVIQATLADEYGIAVRFHETSTICVERPLETGAAVESIPAGGRSHEHPFLATVGLSVAPDTAGAGVTYRRATEVLGTMPAAFFTAVEETVHDTLRQGLYGWQVTDVVVTLTHTGYWPRQSAAHQGFDKAISTTAGDLRALTPLVLMQALERAGTQVLEPIHAFELELPDDSIGVVLPALARLGGVPLETDTAGRTAVVRGDLPAGRVHELRQQLPSLTRGEALLETWLDRHEPVRGTPPRRERTDLDPTDRAGYLRRVRGQTERPTRA